MKNHWKLAIGVMAGVILMAWWLMPNRIPAHVAEVGPSHFQTRPAERKKIRLPDGTVVTLNAGTEMSLDPGFGRHTREIYLKGEAFFDVSQQKDVPFIVHAAEVSVKALGTAFNVRAYADDRDCEAALISGAIEVSLGHKDIKRVILHPDQKIRWKQAGDEADVKRSVAGSKPRLSRDEPAPIRKALDGTIKETAWLDDILVFDDEPFDAIAARLSRWYNVRIDFSSAEVRQYHFTGTFHGERIGKLLDILRLSKEFHYRLEGEGAIVISK